MKKRIAAFTIAVALFASCVTGCGAAQTGAQDKSLENVKEKGKFVLGLDDSFPPMGYRDESGEIVGFDIDLAKEVGRRMGVEVELKPVDWDGIVLSLKNKDIDVIWNGLTITEKRKQEIAFSKVYLQNRQVIVVKSDATIANKQDLSGKVIGLQMGSSSETALDSDADTKNTLKDVRKFTNNTEALMDLSAGGIDAVVVDEIVGRYYVGKKPGEYKVLEDNFGTEEYGIGIRKEDVSFKEEVDRILDEMKKDGTAAQISQEWFGEDIIEK